MPVFKNFYEEERIRKNRADEIQKLTEKASHLEIANIILNNTSFDFYRDYPSDLLKRVEIEALVSIAESLKELTKKP